MTTAIGSSSDMAKALAIQSDGKIVAAGFSSNGTNYDFALVRYNTDGTLDSTFGTGGKVTTAIGTDNDVAYALGIQSDGKIVAVGYSGAGGSNTDFALVRYNADGSLDSTFGTGGKVTTDIVGGSSIDEAYAVGIQSDGKIVAAGRSRNGTNYDFALVRYNTNGTLDAAFGTGGKVTTAIGSSHDNARALGIQSDGKIVVAGESFNGTNYDFALVRYNTDGTLDAAFGTGGKVTTAIGSSNDYANALGIQSDGKIVAAGSAHNGSNDDFALIRYNTDGTLDTTFGTGGKVTTEVITGSSADKANALGIQSDGKIVVGGPSLYGTSDFALVRYNTDGTLESTFGTGGKVTTAIGSGDDYANALGIQSDGKIAVAGSSLNGTSDFAVVRYMGDVVDLPRTGQTTSYATGDDGDLETGVAWPDPRFSDNGNGTITDNLTGLVWTQDANVPGPGACSPGVTKTWQGALDYVACLNANSYLGYTDWRLPNVNELESLVHAGQSDSATWLNSQGFSNVQASYYWSATTTTTTTTFNSSTDFARIVHSHGYMSKSSKTSSSNNVWPVRAGQSSAIAELPKSGQTISYATGDDGDLEMGVVWPSPRFTVEMGAEADCVTDNLTGLMWVKNPDNTTRTWADALTHADGLSLCGYTDWRLPNIKELRSLVNYGQSNPATWLNTQGFNNVQAYDYWSATTYAYLTTNAWIVYMSYGDVIISNKTNFEYVWPVRAGNITGGGADTTPPTGTISINSGAAYTNSTSVTLTLTCTDTGGCSEMQFSNDNTNWSTAEAYATSKAWTLATSDGTKTVYVKFKDTMGNWSTTEISDTITLDTIVPDTTIDSYPSDPTNSTSASFSVSSDEAGSTFECRINGGGYGSCSTPVNYTSLSEGSHTFDVKATDQAGNTDSTPATYTWTVDTPPTGSVIINSGAASTTSASVTLTLSCTDTGSGCSEMLLSNDGVFDTEVAEPYVTSKAWTLPSYSCGQNTSRTVYARFRDATGNWSATYTDTINLYATGGIDLMICSISAPGSATTGQSVSVSNTVTNQGVSASSKKSYVRFYLSADTAYSASDTYLGSRSVLSLSGGGNSSASTSLTIPTSVAPGTYYIIAVADATSLNIESDEGNNAAASSAITVTAP